MPGLWYSGYMDTTTDTDHDTRERVTLPPDYDDCRSIADAAETFKALFRAALDATGLDAWDPAFAERRNRLGEDYRKAMVYLTPYAKGKATPRVHREPTPEPTFVNDGNEITCAGPCGETKSIKKFPTKSGQPGVREGVCRDCKTAMKKGGGK